jgi:phosphoribosylanthranilate isomerase
MAPLDWKVCDVRDLATARLCVRYGATLIGIHCIRGIKPDRRQGLLELCRELPSEHPAVGIVLVSLAVDVTVLVGMASELRPTHLQLHAESWNSESISDLRNALSDVKQDHVKLIGVSTPAQPRERYNALAAVVDSFIIDRQFYGAQVARTYTPSEYQEPVSWAKALHRPVLIAGKLSPDNVAEYVRLARPTGVDVQTGVEQPNSPGVKDENLLSRFATAIGETRS